MVIYESQIDKNRTHRLIGINGKQKYDYCNIWDTEETLYTEQTVKLPVELIIGHRYFMVLVNIYEDDPHHHHGSCM